MSKDKEMENNKVEEDILEEIAEEEINDENLDEKHDENEVDSTRDVDDLTIKLARLQADFVNYKKRSEKEKESSIAYGIETFACELLPIMDNFQRALDSEQEKDNGFFKGVEMILNQLNTLLINKGIEEIDALGMDFDPNFHSAISMEETEEYDSGKVISVYQKGYKYGNKVIRPSMVIVSK